FDPLLTCFSTVDMSAFSQRESGLTRCTLPLLRTMPLIDPGKPLGNFNSPHASVLTLPSPKLRSRSFGSGREEGGRLAFDRSETRNLKWGIGSGTAGALPVLRCSTARTGDVLKGQQPIQLRT